MSEAISDEPSKMSVQPEHLPSALTEHDQWLLWKFEEGAAGERSKEPISPITRSRVSSVDDCTTFETAREIYDNDSSFGGLGFWVTDNDPFVGIQVKSHVEDEENSRADEVVDRFESYTEFTPSGEDTLVVIKGSVPNDELTTTADSLKLYSSEEWMPLTGRQTGESNSIEERQNVLDEVFTNGLTDEESPEWTVTVDEVRETVTKEFSKDMWGVTEAILSAHATLLIGGVQNCTGLLIVGESGAGKTTATRFIEGLDDQVYRSDKLTPASFVSHDSSLSEEELDDTDLLPRIRHKTLVSRDMATWFSGERTTIRDRMSTVAHVMDGDGYTRDSGSHGERGYEGDYRFTFVGATTPLPPRAWRVMGHTGQRFVFYEKRREDTDTETMKEDLFGDKEYAERVNDCRTIVHDFLRELWNEYGGPNGVDDFGATDNAQESLLYLAKVIKYSRAMPTQTDSDESGISREDKHRVAAVLRDIARGRALLHGRTTVQLDDVGVSARIALSTMPKKRRPLVQALLNPANDGRLMASDAMEALDVSRPTALDRMDLLDTLGLGECSEVTDDGRDTKVLKVNEELEWPDELDFPG